MPSKDLHNNIRVSASLAPQTLTGNGDATDLLAIDSQGFEAVEHIVALGTSGDVLAPGLKMDLVLQDSEDGVAFADVTEGRFVLGAVDADGVFATIDDPAADEATYRIGYRGPKRYSRVRIARTGDHAAGTPAAGLAVLGAAVINPPGDG